MLEIVDNVVDSVHTTVELNRFEKRLIETPPMERLRDVHQLSLVHTEYPGATHKRFEHSLGTAKLAGESFDNLLRNTRQLAQTETSMNHPEQLDQVIDAIPESDEQERYWRQIVRFAGFCHDLGHLPFSHSLEELLPDPLEHEYYTLRYIQSDYLRPVIEDVADYFERDTETVVEDLLKTAVGPEARDYKEYDLPDGYPGFEEYDFDFTPWQYLATTIITGDVFGTDRIDYLLRDSQYSGSPAGVFDYSQLLRSLMFLPAQDDRDISPVVIGLNEDGVHAAEGLLIARYFMHQQVYYDPIVLVYAHFMRRFLRKDGTFVNDDGYFEMSLEQHLQLREDEIWTRVHEVSQDARLAGHEEARRLTELDPYELISEAEQGERIMQRLEEKFGERVHEVAHFAYIDKKNKQKNAPVLRHSGNIRPLEQCSRMLESLPSVEAYYLYLNEGELDDELAELREEVREFINDILAVI